MIPDERAGISVEILVRVDDGNGNVKDGKCRIDDVSPLEM
jgi:hypothetical protein